VYSIKGKIFLQQLSKLKIEWSGQTTYNKGPSEQKGSTRSSKGEVKWPFQGNVYKSVTMWKFIGSVTHLKMPMVPQCTFKVSIKWDAYILGYLP